MLHSGTRFEAMCMWGAALNTNTDRMQQHTYEVRPRRDCRGFDLISKRLPFGRLWYTKADHAVGYAKFYSRSHPVVIRVFNDSGDVTETHEHAGEFREP